MNQTSYVNLRKTAIEILGGKCRECGTTEKLQLHHKYYARDSIRPKVHNEAGNQSARRAKEAIQHPERFSLFCLSCHNSRDKRFHKKPVNIAVIFETTRGGVKR